jgi:hypothetical protein
MFEQQTKPQTADQYEQAPTDLESPSKELEAQPESAIIQSKETLGANEEAQTIPTQYKDIALDQFIAPGKTSDSLSAVIIGNAEGTRTQTGGFKQAYGEHIDPGNSKRNRGSFSLQGATNLTPREADRTQQQRMQTKIPAYLAACKSAGIAPTNAVALINYFDMYNIKPALAVQFGALLGELASKGLTIEASIDVRVHASQKTQSRSKWSGWEKIAREYLKKPTSSISDVEFWRVVHIVHAGRVHRMRDAMNALGMKQKGTTTRTRPDTKIDAKTDTKTNTKTDEQKPTTTVTKTTKTDSDNGGGTVTVGVGEMHPLRPGHIISDSVGRGGVNHPADVGVVQQALAAHGHSPGKHDMKIGPDTIAAIVAFQRGFLSKPDGLVEVGHATEKHLMKGFDQTQPETTDKTKDTKPETKPTNA